MTVVPFCGVVSDIIVSVLSSTSLARTSIRIGVSSRVVTVSSFATGKSLKRLTTSQTVARNSSCLFVLVPVVLSFSLIEIANDSRPPSVPRSSMPVSFDQINARNSLNVVPLSPTT